MNGNLIQNLNKFCIISIHYKLNSFTKMIKKKDRFLEVLKNN
jgi:hypothetical protein